MLTCEPISWTILANNVDIIKVSRIYELKVNKSTFSTKACSKLSSTVYIVSRIPSENVDILASSNLVRRLFRTFLMSDYRVLQKKGFWFSPVSNTFSGSCSEIATIVNIVPIQAKTGV